MQVLSSLLFFELCDHMFCSSSLNFPPCNHPVAYHLRLCKSHDSSILGGQKRPIHLFFLLAEKLVGFNPIYEYMYLGFGSFAFSDQTFSLVYIYYTHTHITTTILGTSLPPMCIILQQLYGDLFSFPFSFRWHFHICSIKLFVSSSRLFHFCCCFLYTLLFLNVNQ